MDVGCHNILVLSVLYMVFLCVDVVLVYLCLSGFEHWVVVCMALSHLKYLGLDFERCENLDLALLIGLWYLCRCSELRQERVVLSHGGL